VRGVSHENDGSSASQVITEYTQPQRRRSPNFGTDAAAWGSQLSKVYCAALSVSFSESFELGSGSLARARRERDAALVRQAGTSR
jgi:hypothetical protein